VGSLGQPILFLLALGYGFGPTFARAGAGDYLQFLAPGIVTMGILFTAVFSGIEIIWDRQFRFLKETLVAPVSRLSVLSLFFFSSALFPLDGLPKPLQIGVRINPLTYGVEGLRGALSRDLAFGVVTDAIVLGALAVVLLAIAAYLFSRIEL
jgi:ABC-type multidrug transport system permease subunit